MMNQVLISPVPPEVAPAPRHRIGFHALTLVLLTVMLGGACADDPTVPDTKDDEKDIRFGGLEVLWRIEHEGKVGEVQGFGTMATDGRRVFGDVAQVMVAYDADSGEQLWEFHRPKGGPQNLVVRDGRVLYAGRTAMAIDAETGEELWRFPVNATAGLGYSDADERAFYFGTDSAAVYALGVEDGDVLWRTQLGADWPFGGWVTGVAAAGDTVYAAVRHFHNEQGGHSSAEIFALDRSTGTPLWHWVEGGDPTHQRFLAGSPTVAGELLLVTLLVQNEYIALDRFTAQERWRIEGRNPNAGLLESPEVEGERGYTAANSGEVWAFSLPSGDVLWKSQASSGVSHIEICGSRLVGDAIGWLFVADLDSGDVLFEDALRAPEDNRELIQGDMAVADSRAFASTNRARYGFRCPTK